MKNIFFSKSVKQVLLVSLLFVVSIVFAQAPTITSFTPTSGAVGATVTITGTGFNTTAANNVVYLGALRANVITSTSTSLTITVPNSVGVGLISVANTTTKLIATSSLHFRPTNNVISSKNISARSFANAVSVTTVSGDGTWYQRGNIIAVSDFNNDGKIDIAKGASNTNIGILKNNCATVGAISASDFSSQANVPVGDVVSQLDAGDINGDGKIDLLVGGFNSGFTVVLNNSSGSSIVFGTSNAGANDNDYYYFGLAYETARVKLGDINGDGKLDVICSSYYAGSFRVFLNTSTTSTLSFSTTPAVFTTSLNGSRQMTTGDVNSDGKSDVIMGNDGTSGFLVFLSTSSGNTVSFQSPISLTGNGTGQAYVADVNGDGKNDIIGDGGGVFVNQDVDNAYLASDFALVTGIISGLSTFTGISDFNGNGKIDLIGNAKVSDNKSTNTTLTASNFVTIGFNASNAGESFAAADLDGDNKQDYIASAGSSAFVDIVRNKVGEPINFYPQYNSSLDYYARWFTDPGVWSYSGGYDQNVYTTLDYILNLDLTGATSFTIYDNLTISSQLKFYTAPFDIGYYNLTTSGAISGLSSSAFIKTSGTGLYKQSVSSSPVLFGIGNTTYNPVSITNNTGTADIFGVNVQSEARQTLGNWWETTLGYNSIQRLWSITKTNANSGSGVTITFNWNASDTKNGTVNTPALFYYNSGVWTKISSGVTISGNSLTLTGYTGTLSDTKFAIGDSVNGFAPPPTISSFTPTSAIAGSTITITGTGFTGATAVTVGGTAVTSFTVVSATSITAVVGTATNGTIQITTSGGTATSASSFSFTPSIVKNATLTNFTTCSGTPSNAQTFTVSGNNLTASVSIAALTGYEYSTDGTTYSSTLTLTPTSGSISSTTVYVRLTSASTGTPSGNISLTSTNATTQTIAVTGTVTATSLPTASTSYTVCIGDSAPTISATAASNHTLRWYTVSTGVTASTSAPIPDVSAAGITTYYVSQFNSSTNCESARVVITVTVCALPSAPTATTTINYCQSATATAIAATATSGYSLQWYTASTVGTASTTAPTPATTTVGATTYYVSQKANAGSFIIDNPISGYYDNFISNFGQTFRVTSSVKLNSISIQSLYFSSSNSTTTLKIYSGFGGNLLATADAPFVNANSSWNTNNVSFSFSNQNVVLNSGVEYYFELVNTSTVYTRTSAPYTGGTGYANGSAISQDFAFKLESTLNVNPCESPRTAITVTINAVPTITGAQSMTVGGSTLQLTGSGTPNNTTPWTSSNTAVATISSTGEVTAVAGGNTTITYTNASGCSITAAIRVVDCAQPFGNALAFGQSTDFVQVNSRIFPSNTVANFTIETWIKPDASDMDANFHGFIGSNSRNTSLYIYQGGKIHFSESTGTNFITPNALLTQDKWSHLALVKNGTTITLYVNGVQAYTQACVANFTLSDNYYWLGKIDNQFNGALEEVRFWSTARTQTQLQNTMYTELVGNETGLLAYFDFNEGVAGGTNTSISTITNKANNASNGTLTNFTKTGTSSNFVGSALTSFAISGDAIICANSTSQYTHPMSGGTWSISNGADASINSSGLVTTLENEDVTISYTYSLNGCSITNSKAVSINTPAVPTATTTVNLCEGVPTTALTATPSNGLILQWYTVATGGTASTTAPTPVTSAVGSTIYYVSQKANTGAFTIDNAAISNYANNVSNIGQTFTTASNVKLTSITLKEAYFDYSNASTVLKVYNGVGGSLVATANSAYVNSYSGWLSEISFSFTNQNIILTAGQTYYFEIVSTSTMYPKYSNAYANGSGYINSSIISQDFAFKLVSTIDASPCESSRTAITVNVNAVPTITGAQNMTVGGNTLQLTGSGTAATTNPWVSSTTGIATISNTGEVTSVAGGTTSITYTTAVGCSISQNLRVIDCAQPFGNALNFDGTNDVVEIPDANSIDVTTAFTIEAWVYPTTVTAPNASQVIIGKIVDNTLGNAADIAYALRFSSGGFSAQIGNGSTAQVRTSANYTLNKWQHVAMVFSGANSGSLSLYIDGVLQGTTLATNYSSIQNIATSLKLGAYNTHFGQYFKGSIDEFRIWNVAKTQAQIAASIYSEMLGNETGLVTYLGFNQGMAVGNNSTVTNLLNSSNVALNGSWTNFAKTGTTSNFIGNSSANIDITGAATLCANSTTQYTHQVSGGTWSVSSGANAAISATGLLTAAANEDITISYTYIVNGCSFIATRAISINTPDAPVATATVNLCQGITASALAATATTGNTLQWYTVATGGTASTTAPTPSSATLGTLTYYVSQKNNTTNCESSRAAITVTVNVAPTISGAQSMTVGGNTLQLTGSGTAATTNPWVSSTTGIATISNTGEVTAVGAGSSIITYTVATGCTATAVISVVDCGQPFGNALQFDGVNDSFSTASNLNALNITSNITIETWIKFDQVHSDYVRIIGKGDNLNRTYGFWLGTNGKLLFQIWNSAGSGLNLEANTALQPGIWYHISATRNGNTSKIYINGIEDVTTTTTVNPQTNTLPLTVGYGNMHTWLKGALDEVRIWNVARTISQIQQGMYNALVGNETGLVAYYDFNQGIAGGDNSAVNSVLDRTINVLHGTLTNFAKTGTASNFVGNTAANFAITGVASLCANSTAQYAHQVLGGTWSVTNGANATISATGLLTAAANEDITVSYTYVVNGCSFTATKAISINTPAAPVATATVNLCQGITASALAATALSGHTLQWYTVATGGTASTTAPTPSASTIGSTIFHVSQKNNTTNCESTRTAIAVTVNAIPTITGIQSMTLGGATLQLTGSGTAATINPWVSSTTGIATISNTGEVTAVAGGTTSITYTTAVGCSISQTLRVIDCAQPFNNSLSFDGVNDYLVLDNVGTNTNFQFTNTSSYSIEAWVKRNANTANSSIILSKQNGGVAGNYSLGLSATGVPYLSREAAPWVVNVTSSIPINEWHHIAGVFDGSTLKIYIDGLISNSIAASGSITPSSVTAIKVAIGAMYTNNSPTNFFNGSIDEARVWNVARTASQISQNYSSSLQGNETGLVAYYDFNQGLPGGDNTAITSIVNTVNSASNGTLTNFTKTGTTSNFIGNTTANISISGASNLCANATSQFTHIVAGGTWSVSSGAAATVSTSGLVTTLGAESMTISYLYTVNGCSFTAAKAVAIVAPAITAQPSTTAQNVCINGITATIAVTATGSGITYQWYRNTSATNTGGTLISGATNSVFMPSNTLVGTTYYYCVVSSTCSSPITSSVSGAITIAPASAAGTITGTASICSGATTTLTLSGNVGSVQWQLMDSTVWTNIAGATTTTFTTPALTQNTTYRAVVTSGVCSAVNTANFNVVVNPLPVISGTTSVGAGESVTLTATTTAASSNAWVSSTPAVASVSNTGVINGLMTGTTTITYTNSNGCTDTEIITVEVGTTQAPVLTLPATNTTGATTLNFNYTLPETPLAGSVRLTFTPVGGGAPIIWTMTNATSAVFSYVVGTNPTTISNVVSGAALGFTTYDVTLAYQDSFSNPSATVTNTNVQTLAPPSISFANTTYNEVINVSVSIQTINTGGAMETYSITPSLPAGLTLNTTTGLISGVPTSTLALTTFIVTVTNAAGTDTESFTLFIDADTDGDGIGNTTDPDIDGDGTLNGLDTNPTNPCLGFNANTASSSWQTGDCDGDGIQNGVDNCPTIVNTSIVTQPSTQTVNSCLSTVPFTLTVVAAGQQLTYQWYSNTSNSNVGGTVISGATTATYVPTTSYVSRYYYVVVSGTCGTVTSNVSGAITINPTSLPGSIAGATSVCSGTNSTVLTLSGNTGTIQWQSSTDNISFTNITGATASTFTATNLTAPTHYRAVVNSGVCSLATTASVTITVSPISVAGSIAGATSVCSGTNTTVLTLSGNTGTIQWQSSTDNITFTTIASATASTYTATNITATTYYRAIVTSGVCSSATTASVTITVSPTSLPGSIAGATSVCSGTNSTVLTLSGNTGTIQWQWSTDNVTFFNIPSATTSTYTASNITVTTYYRAVVTSGVCSSATTTVSTITVNPTSVAGSIAGAATVCSGTNATVLTLSGNTGTIQWQSSTNNVAFTTITGATASTFTATNLTVTTYYRSVITSGVCASATTASVTITVNPTSVAGSIAGATTVCSATNSTVLTLSGNTGTIQWQSSTDNSTFTTITGATASTYTATNITVTTYYRALVTSGICSSATTVVATITNIPIVAPTAVSNQQFCYLNNPTISNLVTTSGVGIKWYSNATGGIPLIGLTPLTTATTYYASQTISVCESPTRVVVTVLLSCPVDAIADNFGSINGYAGATTASVLANDTINGGLLLPSQVILTGVTVPTGLTLNANGTITIAPQTAAGTYNVTYRICELLNPTNCDTVTFSIIVGACLDFAINDCDLDGESNGIEAANGTNPSDVCSYTNPPASNNVVYPTWSVLDCDGDGVINGQEITDGTSPINPCSSNPINITVPLSTSFLNGDCDNDGLLNGEEMGSNVNYPNDSNGNGIPDYLEVNNHTVSEDNLEVYSSLTPNGDGNNDVFIIRNIENYPENNVSIFNRWGIIVYDVDGYGQNNKYFKGISEGRITINSQDELPVGTYFYIIKYKNNNGEQKQRSGYLYINR